MKKVLLLILDGFGMTKEINSNMKNAEMPNFNNIWNNYPHSLLGASGQSIGLKENQVGGSEIGHISIGAGRKIKNEITQMNEMFKNNNLRDNEVYQEMVNYASDNDKPIHIMALLSDAGKESHIAYVLNMIDKLNASQIDNICVHVITDGKDVDDHSALKYIDIVEEKLNKYNIGKIVSVCGRYFAMDQNNKWKRTKYYSDMLTKGIGVYAKNIKDVINVCYKKNINDEKLPPILLDKNKIIKDGDVLLWMNFKNDGGSQIMQVLTDSEFDKYDTLRISNLKTYTIFPMPEAINSSYLLDSVEVSNPIGVYLESLGLSQARIAEGEKNAQVNYFFDGNMNTELDKCKRYLIPSPNVSSYALKPAMSSFEITKKILRCLNDNYDLIVANYANIDKVSDTKDQEAIIKALEAVDNCLGSILEYANENFYTVFITSSHANLNFLNIEDKKDLSYYVPFIVTDNKVKLVNGSITDIAPTILKYMDIKIPDEMKDSDLLFEEE